MAQFYGQYKNKRVFGTSPEDVLKQSGGETPTEWKQFTNETWQPFTYIATTQPTLEQKFEQIAPVFHETRPDLPKPADVPIFMPGMPEPVKAPEIPETKMPETTEEITQGQAEPFVPPEAQAPSITDTYTQSMLATLETQRKTLEDTYKTQLANIQKQLETSQKRQDDLMAKQKDILKEDVEKLTEPFREEKEKSERERLKVEENYFANQQLVNELEGLLTGIQTDLQAQRDVTGLAAIRNPRIAKAAEEATARIGVIEATMNARNGQINVANNLIDRTVTAMTADRQDQLSYYNALLSFYSNQSDTEGAKILQLTKDEKATIAQQTNLIENDLAQTQASVNYIKSLMLDPDTAQIVAQSGVTLNDTPEQVNIKLANYAYQEEIVDMNNKMEQQGYNYVSTPQQLAGKDQSSLLYMKDSKGNSRAYYKKPEAIEWSEPYMMGGDLVQRNSKTGQIRTAVNISGGSAATLTPFNQLPVAQQVSINRLNAQIQRGEIDYDATVGAYPSISGYLKSSTLSPDKYNEARAQSEANRKIQTWKALAEENSKQYKIDENEERIIFYEAKNPDAKWYQPGYGTWKKVEEIELVE